MSSDRRSLACAALAALLLAGAPGSWARAADDGGQPTQTDITASASARSDVAGAGRSMDAARVHSPDEPRAAAPAVPAIAASPAALSQAPSRGSIARSRSSGASVGASWPWPGGGSNVETAQALRIVLGLTAIALLPALVVCLTSFLRIIIVLSMLRHAIGMNETPPNMVLTGLALFLTLFTMSPVLQRMNQDALQPFMQSKLSMEAGYERGMAPLREFMVRQTREQDLALVVELSKATPPRTIEDVSNVQLIPAFMLSELRAAFQVGFVVFLPFLLIDLVVSSILMALGMMMMPPTTISLPLKILMFVLIDGWSLLLKALVGSFR